MPSTGCAVAVVAAGPVWPGWARVIARTPDTPTVVPSAQPRERGWWSTMRSMTAAAGGAEPMETTVPTATPASRVMFTHRGALTAQWRTMMVSAGAVAVFPLAFYSSMRLAGVAVGTVVSIGSAPPAAAVIEHIVDHQPLSRGWALGTTVGVSGVLALALAHPGQTDPAATTATAQPVLGIALGLLAGFTYAIYSWGSVRVMRCGLPSRPVMGAVFGLGGVLILPVLALTGAPIITSGSNLAVAAYLAIVPMFLGYIFFGRGLATVAASTATTVSLLEPCLLYTSPSPR